MLNAFTPDKKDSPDLAIMPRRPTVPQLSAALTAAVERQNRYEEILLDSVQQQKKIIRWINKEKKKNKKRKAQRKKNIMAKKEKKLQLKKQSELMRNSPCKEVKNKRKEQAASLAPFLLATHIGRWELLKDGRTPREIGNLNCPDGMLLTRARKIHDAMKRGQHVAKELAFASSEDKRAMKLKEALLKLFGPTVWPRNIGQEMDACGRQPLEVLRPVRGAKRSPTPKRSPCRNSTTTSSSSSFSSSSSSSSNSSDEDTDDDMPELIPAYRG